MNPTNCPFCGSTKRPSFNQETNRVFCPDCGTNLPIAGRNMLADNDLIEELLLERQARQLAEADARTLAGAIRRMNRQLYGLEESTLGNENAKLHKLLEKVIPVCIDLYDTNTRNNVSGETIEKIILEYQEIKNK